MVAESWFRNLWKPPRKYEVGAAKAQIGVLAFEVASMMSKLVNMWQSLSDKQIGRLREEIKNSVGIRKLVSEDDDFIVGLICAEMIENLERVANSVARLGMKCSDPSLKNFEHFFGDLIKIGADPYGWKLTRKKMERKIKKMERFISVNGNLYQEIEMLVELEQTVRRTKGNNGDPDNLLQLEKKVLWKQHEVKSLRMSSLWNRTYDYTVRLLARSVFTIFSRIKHVFGFQQTVDLDYIGDSGVINSDYIHSSHLVSALMQSSDYPSENGLTRFSSGPLGWFTTKSGPISKTSKNKYFQSGPLGSSTTKSGPMSRKNKNANFYSGPLGKSTAKSGPISGTDKFSKKMWQGNDRLTTLHGNKPFSKPYRLSKVGPFKGCMMAGNSSPVANCYLSVNAVNSRTLELKDSDAEPLAHSNKLSPKSSISSYPRTRLLNPPPETLGASALALHYANVIIVIEKLAASPHLIGHDARDDLYNMLPAMVRSSLRAALKPYTRTLASSVYDMELAGEWSEAISGILEWLAPLAHNMIKWQSERSLEQQSFISRTNVLLVQTLYYANQEKIEAAITELLVGLNYIWRFGKERDPKTLMESVSSRVFNEYLDLAG